MRLEVFAKVAHLYVIHVLWPIATARLATRIQVILICSTSTAFLPVLVGIIVITLSINVRNAPRRVNCVPRLVCLHACHACLVTIYSEARAYHHALRTTIILQLHVCLVYHLASPAQLNYHVLAVPIAHSSIRPSVSPNALQVWQ